MVGIKNREILSMSRYDNYNPEILYPEIHRKDDSRTDLPPAGKNTGKGKQGSDQKPAKKSGNNQKKTPKPSGNGDNIFSTIKKWANSQNTQLIVGIIAGCVGIYFLVSFISYLSDCFKDQAVINNSPIGMATDINNSGGEGGARLSEFLINKCFGLGSFVIIFWLLAMSSKLLIGKPRFKSVNFTIKCIVALITVSLIVGLITIGVDTTVNWGGYHGRYVNLFIVDFTGWWGAILLCIMLIGIFVVICLRDMIVYINGIRKKRALHKQMVAEEKAKRLEEQRVIEEMRAMEHQEDITSGAAGSPEVEEDIKDSTLNFSDDNAGLYEEIEDDSFEDSGLYTTINGSPEQYPAAVDTTDANETSSTDASQPESKEIEEKTEETAEEQSGEGTISENDKEIAPEAETSRMVVNVNTVSAAEKIDRRSERYKFPPLEILRQSDDHPTVDAEEQLENQEQIRKTLADFGIPIVDIEATVGPTVTLYEIKPDKGQKVSKIKSLVDDISLSLSAIGVRIIAPIPGKGTVGIEVANKDPRTVSMRTVIGSRKYQESRYKLPVALGLTINNDVYIADLTKMPHMLVAGATGQGKSVGLNVIIASLLYRKKPHELKFVMIDPKMVEFSLYAKIEKHYLAKLPGEDKAIITDMAKAVATLNSLVQEMEDRYTLLMGAGCRKFEEYNEKFLSGQLDPKDGHRFMPYIVVIIDEFCDLIMTQGKEVEKPIARLAQKARAVGIHEIIATQRPSTTVITGNIKANFLTRMAFKVSSSIDSKTILDTTGAQQLIGAGDMLINFNSEMTRVQCAFMDTPEVEAMTEYIARQPYNSGPYILPEPQFTGEGGEGGFGEEDGIFDKDPKFLEIATHVVNTGYASTSNIQRKFSIGYNRAGKIMDQLEAMGVVSKAQGGKPRTVLMSPQEAMEVINQYV